MNTGPLSVMISQRVPHQHRMSSKIQSLIIFAVSAWREQYLGKCAREQRLCMKYLKLPDFRRCMVSMYILVNKGVGVATTRGMRTLQVWWSWHMWQSWWTMQCQQRGEATKSGWWCVHVWQSLHDVQLHCERQWELLVVCHSRWLLYDNLADPFSKDGHSFGRSIQYSARMWHMWYWWVLEDVWWCWTIYECVANGHWHSGDCDKGQ